MFANLFLNLLTDGEWFGFLELLITAPFLGIKSLYEGAKSLSKKNQTKEIDNAVKERVKRIHSGAVSYINMGFDKRTAMDKAEKDLVAEAHRTLNQINEL